MVNPHLMVELKSLMFLLIIGSAKLQDPNLVYAALNEIYRNISYFETLTILYPTGSGQTEEFLSEWVEERLKAQDRVEMRMVETVDVNLLKNVQEAVVFFQDLEDNLEIIEYVGLLEEAKVPFEKFKSHNFLPRVNQ